MAYMGLNIAEWNRAVCIILDTMGPFDPERTYCGPGKIGDALVPDLCFRLAGYAHDGLYEYLIRTGNDHITSKGFADLFFKGVMLSICDRCPVSGVFICDNVLPEVYYQAVKNFGNPEHEETKQKGKIYLKEAE